MDDDDFASRKPTAPLFAPKRPNKNNHNAPRVTNTGLFTAPLFTPVVHDVEDDSFGLTANSPTKDDHRCPMCNKDLSHLNEARRLAHSNGCLDLDESKQNFNKATERHSKTIDCPICSEPLPPGPHRAAHMKRCAREHEVSANKLVQLVDTQTKAAEIKKKKNIAHTKARAPVLKAVNAPKLKGQPKTELDEDTQLALAISASTTVTNRIDAVKEASAKFTKLADPNENRRKRPRSYAIVELAPRSCKCEVMSTIHTRFLEVFRVRGKATTFTEESRRADKATTMFAAEQRRILDKLNRFEQLSRDMGRLVDSPTDSDFTVCSSDGIEHKAHRGVLQSRTKNLVSPSGRADVEESHQLVSSWLKYVYSARIEWSLEDNDRMRVLADKHGPECLSDTCRRLTQSSNDSENSDNVIASGAADADIVAKESVQQSQRIAIVPREASPKLEEPDVSQSVGPINSLPASPSPVASREKVTSRTAASLTSAERVEDDDVNTVELDCEDPLQGLNMTASTDSDITILKDVDEIDEATPASLQNQTDDDSIVVEHEAKQEEKDVKEEGAAADESVIFCLEKSRSPDLFDDDTSPATRIDDSNPSWTVTPLKINPALLDTSSASSVFSGDNVVIKKERKSTAGNDDVVVGPSTSTQEEHPKQETEVDYPDYPDYAQDYYTPLDDYGGGISGNGMDWGAAADVGGGCGEGPQPNGRHEQTMDEQQYLRQATGTEDDTTVRISPTRQPASTTAPPVSEMSPTIRRRSSKRISNILKDSFDVTILPNDNKMDANKPPLSPTPHPSSRDVCVSSPSQSSFSVAPLAHSTPAEPANKRLKFASNVKVLKTAGITPMPNFAEMDEQQLKAELARCGMRPLGRKRAIETLQRMYEETHPVVDPSTPTARPLPPRPQNVLPATGQDESGGADKKKVVKRAKKILAPSLDLVAEKDEGRSGTSPAKNSAATRKKESTTRLSPLRDDVMKTDEDGAESSESYEMDRTLNESGGEQPLEDTILDDNGGTGAAAAGGKDLESLTANLIAWLRRDENEELYNHMLTMQPVMLDELHIRLSRADDVVCTISKKALAAILNGLGVTFSLPQPAGGRRGMGGGGGGGRRRK